MNKKVMHLALMLVMMGWGAGVTGGDSVRYSGGKLVNIDFHHGQLTPVLGVHNIQVMRASREFPETADGMGWTYNHAPMLAYWNGRFYLEYLTNPVGEHIPPSQSMLTTSADGYHWDKPVSVFPVYRIPDGTVKPGVRGVARNLDAVMHQRMGFYVSGQNRLLCLGYYGMVLSGDDSPNDGHGIGRVVREIRKDGSFGPLFFIRYNKGWNEKNSRFPFYKSSSDTGFVNACDELLARPLMMQQWVEEADRDDPLIPLKSQYKALSFYHLPDGRVVGWWKHALSALTTDEGVSWSTPRRAPGFVNGNAKIWGQRTSDGRFITVYNPSEFRWPLALSVSDDGLDYKNLLLVHGEITPMRYGGAYKSYGPQYVRGIQEGNGNPPGGKAWVTYSMNKEDIWVSSIPVPVTGREVVPVRDIFPEMKAETELERWNIYSPVFAPVRMEMVGGERWLALRDSDEFDFAKAERLFPETKTAEVEFVIRAGQNDHGLLHVEFVNPEGTPAIRLVFDNDGNIRYKDGYRVKNLAKYQPGENYTIKISADANSRFYSVFLDGRKVLTALLFAPVNTFQRITFRTGEPRRFPDVDTPTDQDFDIVQSGKAVPEASFYLRSLEAFPASQNYQGLLLKASDYEHYVDYFNRMEDENRVTDIPNSRAWTWMEENIPLFACPQENFQEIYYFRWWSFRKHLKKTPAGWAITEFLVERSYADLYNLIACALGHHTYESRWLRDTRYLRENLMTWYRSNQGGPMAKLHAFSSWTPAAVYQYFLATGDFPFVADILPDLEADFRRWEAEKRLSGGLFWQYDVRDGMEEQISGGRREKNIRPTINSYMYGNAAALSKMAEITGNRDWVRLYVAKADTLKRKIETTLWNPESGFFETVKETGGFAGVREAIGFIPWYFNLPDHGKELAWHQLTDTEGFLAPFGITTAEQRHPEFRSHGCCNCEWDGAVWPFATSQTLTAMANLLNNYHQKVVTESDYFDLLETYVESQYYRGRPYIGEYLDGATGYWLKGDQERSRYYNHSTFNDLIITGLAGLRPRADDLLEVHPLLPEGKWDWFCLDRLPYHGKIITIIWDRTGDKFGMGKGLTLFVNGRKVAGSETLTRIICSFNDQL